MLHLSARAVSLRSLPREVLELKKSFDVDRLLDMAENPAIWTFAIEERGALVGVVIFMHDTLYSTLCVDTLIVLPERRGLKALREIAGVVVAVARALGDRLEVRRIHASLRGGERFARWFPEARVIHTTIGEDRGVSDG